MSDELTISDDGFVVLGDDTEPAISRADQVHAMRKIVRQAQISRLPPPDFSVAPASGDVGETGELDMLSEILGAVQASDTPAPFTPIDAPDYPLLQKLYRRYRAAMPSAKVVRVDGDESYKQYKAEKRRPYEARLAALESALAAHVADQHGGGRLAKLEDEFHEHVAHHPGPSEILGALETARERVAVCGEHVPLSLAPSAKGKVECWQDGPTIYCSVRVLGKDGKIKVLTTSTPADRHVEDVLGYAADAGVDSVEVMDVLPVLAQVLGGGGLVTQLCGAASELTERGAGTHKISPKCDPAQAAVMSLLQMCKGGNADACEEAEKLRRAPGGAKMLAQADKALEKARKELR